MTPLRLAIGLALLTASVPAGPVHAFTDLLGGKSLSARDHPTPTKDSFKVVYKDPALTNLVNPTCSAANASSLQIITSNEVLPVVNLPCGNWKSSGPGYTYKALAGGPGGIRSIRFRFGQLKVSIKDGPYSSNPANGGIQWLETRFTVGGETYCGRWETPPSTFKRNLVDQIKAKGPTRQCEETCGNGLTEAGEQCDDGDTQDGDGCDNNCTLTACGNGIPTSGEDCDDGNTANGDGCRNNCTVELCGDSITDPQEDCDDGNTANGDCCESDCDFEPAGSSCPSDPNACTTEQCDGAGSCASVPNSNPCDDGNDCTTDDACSGGSCVGDPINPWVNEFDYDSNDTLSDDDDEFIEIAGPAGLNLSGYKIASVEGAGFACGTPAALVNAGDAHFTSTIPNGTILGNDTGTGVGFLVVCFQNTSANIAAAGDCDVTLPAPATDSNLMNGDLLNLGTTCPDGFVLLDPSNNYVEAISYEGVVPNSGTHGAFFQVNPYNAGRDEGFKAGVSMERSTSNLGPAAGASAWKLSDGCVNGGLLDNACVEGSHTPGTENPPQTLDCNIVYGSPQMAFLDAPMSLLE